MNLKDLLSKRLKIYENEFRVFAWLAFLFLMVFFITAVFRNYVETAFLKRYGPENLPLMFVINGFITIFFIGALNRTGSKADDHKLLAGIFLGYSAALDGLFYMVKADVELSYPILFQLLYLLDSLIIVYLWNVANSLITARQANRLFPLLTAFTVAGAAMGSFLGEPLARVFGNDSLLPFSSFIFLISGLFLIWKPQGIPFKEGGRPEGAPKYKINKIPSLIKRYPMLRYLVIIGFIPNILLPIFFYQFSVIANSSFGTEQGLMSFLGYFRGGMTAAVFIILFFVSSLYKKMGLMRVSLVYPINLVFIFGGLFFFFNIYIAAAGQFLIRLIQRAVSGPVAKVFFLMLPSDIAKWSQVFVRGIVVNAGMITGALLLEILKPVIDARTMALPAVGLALYMVIETVIYGRRFKSSLKQAVVGKNIDYDAIEKSYYSPNTMDAAESYSIPSAPKEMEVDETRSVEIPPHIALKQLDDPDEEVRAQAVRSFYDSGYLPVVKRLVEFLDDREIVRKAAMDVLARYPAEILTELENALHRLSWRGQRGVLEVMRLAGMKKIDEVPYAARLLAEAFNNLSVVRALRMLPPAAGRELIIEHLTQTNDLILELLFQTLWVKYDDMRLIYKALKSREASVAVEMLECSIKGELADCILHLVDDLPLDEKLNRVRLGGLPVIRDMTLDRCAGYLASRKDSSTRMLAGFFLAEVADATFDIVIQHLLDDKDGHVRDAAYYAVKRKNGQEPPMPDLMEKVFFLKSCLVFDGLGVRELTAIASVAVLQTYQTDEVIVGQGDEDLSLHLIMQGKVRAVREKSGGGGATSKTMGRTSFFGLLRLFSGGPADETYIAAEPASILTVNKYHFEEIMKLYPQIGINLCTFFALRLETFQLSLEPA